MSPAVADLMTDLKWSEAKVINGKAMSTAEPTEDFWDIYRAHKEELKKQGISVSKYTGVWQVCWWKPMEIFYTEKYSSSKKVKELKKSVVDNLLPYQVSHTIQLTNAVLRFGAAIDGSDAGTGKTYSAVAIAKQLNMDIFVVSLKTGIATWLHVAKKFGVKIKGIHTYEKIKGGRTEFLKLDNGDGFEWHLPKNTLLVFDEVHRCKDHKTQNSKMLIQAKKQEFKILNLSATIADNPLQMKAVGYVIQLFPKLSDFFGWARGMGCEKTETGFEFIGSDEDLKRIHNTLYPDRGSRMRIKDLGDQFPETQITAEIYTMDSAKEIQKVYIELEEKLAAIEETGETELAVTIMLKARQRVELLKVPFFIDLIKEYIENNRSVVMFINFNATREALMEAFKGNAVSIHGGQSLEERNADVAAFQSSKKRIMIANIKAGGVSVSLHDVDGKHPRVSLISPTASGQDLIQTFGRVHRAGGKSKSLQRLIFAADTVEERVAEILQAKIARIEMLNDGMISDSDLTTPLFLSKAGKKK